MVFSSTIFLFLFLPLTFLLSTIIPNIKLKNFFLVAVSLFFYAFGEPLYVVLMLASVVFNYLTVLAFRSLHLKKAALVIAVAGNLALLGAFKYAGFAAELINLVPFINITVPAIRLPIGISFYTFQALSYVIDCYREPEHIQTKLSNVLLYISFFPQLIAGPILKYHDIDRQICERKQTPDGVAFGIRRLICGLSKKLLIANIAGGIADAVFSMEPDALFLPSAWLGAIAYCLQIYFDFSGYSDMAIGLGRMLGFSFPENFNYPYIAGSVKDFWRRWHISLSTWFREYLYIPLGGNRKGKLRTVINKYIVFFMTGLWHGASLSFVLWGLWHGTFLTLEDSEIIPVKKLPRVVTHIYTLLVVCVGFVIFRAETLSGAWHIISAMFTGFAGSAEAHTLFATQLTPFNITVITAGIVLCMPLGRLIYEKLDGVSIFREVASYTGSLVLLFMCIVSLASSSFNPFIYFRF